MFRIVLPLHHLWLFPLIAGTSWFITLTALLSTWIARGMPRYPRQNNPYIAFISDIAAFQLKPLFLIGSSLTASCFMVTVYAVHFSRYDGRMYGIDDVRWKKTVSLLAVLSGVVGGVSLILLAVMDTFRFHEEHAVLLLVCFLGLAMSALLTTVVYWDQMWYPSPFKRLRTFCLASAITIAVDFCLGVAFYSFLETGYQRVSGILEWIMAFTGSIYLWSFIGLVSVPEHGIDEAEREALLRRERE